MSTVKGSHTTTPTSSHQLQVESGWVYPTGADYGSYPYSYPGGTYSYEGYDPQSTSHPSSGSAASLGSERKDGSNGPGMTRGANYFFGFLITFITLLLLFVACGIGSRRRIAARRRREDLLSGGGQRYVGPRVLTFRGLLAAGSNRQTRDALGNEQPMEEDIMKQKPTYHEVCLAYGNEKQGSQDGLKQKARSVHLAGFQGKGAEAWFALEPLSATVVRPPKDFKPYQHFRDILASGSTHNRNDSRFSTGLSPLLPSDVTDRDSLPPYEAVDPTAGSWHNRILPSWASSRSTELRRQVSTIALPRPDIELKNINREMALGDNEGDVTTSGQSSGKVEVAVMVAMPNEAERRRLGNSQTSLDKTGSSSTFEQPRPIPECQIGVATVRLADIA